MKEGAKIIHMAADVAVQATEQHLKVVEMIEDQNVAIADLHADMDRKFAVNAKEHAGMITDIAGIKSDLGVVKADVSSLRAEVSALNAKMTRFELVSQRRHEELLGALRARSLTNA